MHAEQSLKEIYESYLGEFKFKIALFATEM